MHSCCSGLSCLTAVEQRHVGDVVDHGRLRAALGAPVLPVGVEHVAGGDLEPVPARLEVVGDQVAGDRDQPGAEVAALPGEAADPLERAQEGVRGQVLGQRTAADPEVDEPEHRVEVAVVDLAEGVRVAGLGPLDQRPHLGGGVVGRRSAGPRRRHGPAGSAPGAVGVRRPVGGRRRSRDRPELDRLLAGGRDRGPLCHQRPFRRRAPASAVRLDRRQWAGRPGGPRHRASVGPRRVRAIVARFASGAQSAGAGSGPGWADRLAGACAVRSSATCPLPSLALVPVAGSLGDLVPARSRALRRQSVEYAAQRPPRGEGFEQTQNG